MSLKRMLIISLSDSLITLLKYLENSETEIDSKILIISHNFIHQIHLHEK